MSVTSPTIQAGARRPNARSSRSRSKSFFNRQRQCKARLDKNFQMIFGQKRWQSAVNCLDLREGLLARAPSRQWQASRQWQPLCRDLVNPLSLPHPTILQHTLCNTVVQIPMFCNGHSATFVYCTFAEGHYSGLSRQRSICEISPRKVQPKTAPDSVTPYTNL